ncbi:EPIDERMAL PATTERNING FACTOR-like protein 2 [Hordeum vulgare subsp. vulgare]|uniref:Epidermal patterning factor-like protein n=1 Tax=Hordeum vulgare subsp. vulgare TaxID=112509 RepID=M0WEF5_HORVV|nr:EPIDERMAL PATTERNING FACTOR-like protein 2 [Hordeum vulgare subsp. vulgare]
MVHLLQCSGSGHMLLPLFFLSVLLLFPSMESAHSDARRLPLRLLEIGSSKEQEGGARGETMKMERRGLIGSRPPRCERVCMSCGHCEAVQVPIVPQDHKQRAGREHHDVASDTYRVNGGISDYKPLSWKCRCGGRIHDP